MALVPGVEFITRAGRESFDLSAGANFLFVLDPSQVQQGQPLQEGGLGLDVGFTSRSPETGNFADLRTGLFFTTSGSQLRVGPQLRGTIWWADDDFRGGVDLRMLFDALGGRHAVIGGGTFSY